MADGLAAVPVVDGVCVGDAVEVLEEVAEEVEEGVREMVGVLEAEDVVVPV